MMGIEKWRQVVIDHYGSIDKFPDARTVRIYLKFCEENLEEYAKDSAACAKAGCDDFWIEERQKTETYKAELEKWLADRNLPR